MAQLDKPRKICQRLWFGDGRCGLCPPDAADVGSAHRYRTELIIALRSLGDGRSVLDGRYVWLWHALAGECVCGTTQTSRLVSWRLIPSNILLTCNHRMFDAFM